MVNDCCSCYAFERFTLSAVSPAVLVPSLFRLKRLGYGEVKGINTLLIAASSLDDTVSISAFGILLGVLFSTGTYTAADCLRLSPVRSTAFTQQIFVTRS